MPLTASQQQTLDKLSAEFERQNIANAPRLTFNISAIKEQTEKRITFERECEAARIAYHNSIITLMHEHCAELNRILPEIKLIAWVRDGQCCIEIDTQKSRYPIIIYYHISNGSFFMTVTEDANEMLYSQTPCLTYNEMITQLNPLVIKRYAQYLRQKV